MVLWAAVFAALVGWLVADFDEGGFFAGGLLGAVFGWGARRVMRAELAAAVAPLHEHIAALTARLATSGDQGSQHERTVAEIAAPVARVERRPATATEPAPVEMQARAAAEPTPAEPRPPGAIETLAAGTLATARAWLFGGNTIVRVGLVILFVGLAFLASYAASAGLFPIELRLMLVAAIGIALLVIGFRTRHEHPGFGTALQGAGVAAIYLTLFAAARLYDTVPIVAAFALMIAVCALGCALALLQRSQALAATSFAGGFAVPLLLSTGGGAVGGLFGYYTILNLAVVFIAGRRSWRVVNLIGFLATFGVATAWEAASYRQADFAVTQAFLIVSVLIYVATAMLYARRMPGRLGHVVDTTLLFGPALAGFGLEVGLVGDRPFGSAFAAIAFAALYLGVALVAGRRRPEFRVMNETMLAIAIGFVTLAVPLALGARWTSTAWALEGAGAFWVGLRQARWVPRLFGLALQLVAALVFLSTLNGNVAALPLVDPVFMGATLIALAALASAWWLRDPLSHGGSPLAQGYARIEAALATPTFLLGFFFWWLAWTMESARALPPVVAGGSPVPVFAPDVQRLLPMLGYLASAWAAQAVGRRHGWTVATWPSQVSLVPMALAFLVAIDAGAHLLITPFWAIWAAAVTLHLLMLRANDRDARAPARAATRPLVQATHVGGAWLATAMLADMLWLAVDRAGLWRTGWADVVPLAGLVAVLAALTLWAGRAAIAPASTRRWPLNSHARDYTWWAAAPLAALLVLVALLTALLSPGTAEPLPFLPLLNPVDLGLALALVVIAYWRRTVGAVVPVPPGAAIPVGPAGGAALAALAFVGINTAWLRAAHHLLGIAWSADALLASFVVQAGLALLWTLLALGLMVAAHRSARRALWLVGAGLLSVTVVKLLLVDLTNANGAARVVAFMGVGGLMLIVGYLAPLPPRGAQRDAEPATGALA